MKLPHPKFLIATTCAISIATAFWAKAQDDLGGILPTISPEPQNVQSSATPNANAAPAPTAPKPPKTLDNQAPIVVAPPAQNSSSSVLKFETDEPNQQSSPTPPILAEDPQAAPAPANIPLPGSAAPNPARPMPKAPPAILADAPTNKQSGPNINLPTKPSPVMEPTLPVLGPSDPTAAPPTVVPSSPKPMAPKVVPPANASAPKVIPPSLSAPQAPNAPIVVDAPKPQVSPKAPELPPIEAPGLEDLPPIAPPTASSGPQTPYNPAQKPQGLSAGPSTTPLAPEAQPALEDLGEGGVVTSEGPPNEAEVASLVEKLEKEAAKKEAAKGVMIPNQRQDIMDYDKVSLTGILRLLAMQAGFNFIEPELPQDETISFRFQNMTPLEAFMRIARARGFSVVTRDGYTTLMRPDLVTSEFMVVRKYRLRHSQPKWVIQGVANLLGIEVTAPANTLASYPEPDESATSFGGSNNGGQGGTTGGNTGTTTGTGSNGSQNIGLPTAPRWTPSLPFDEPSFKGEGTKDGSAPSYVFVDRSSNSLVVRATETMQKAVGEYLKSVDKPEPQILIETKVVEVTVTDQLIYGIDWKGLDEGITVTASAKDIDLVNFANALATGNTFSLVLTTSEVSATLRAFQKYGNGSVVNMPKTMTRSNVPVAMSSTITDATPSYQLATSTGGAGAVSVPSGFNTFTTGLTIDLVPQLLENGMIDINVNPNVANKIGEQVIDATDTTPKQTIPIISSRSITASAVVPSGMTVMIGGLTEQANNNTENGIPLLQKIPILGKTIFGSEDKTAGRKTLLIFLTPKIVYPDQYEEVYTDKEEWEAMVNGNRANTETETVPLPKHQIIRRAEPVRDYMQPRPYNSPATQSKETIPSPSNKKRKS